MDVVEIEMEQQQIQAAGEQEQCDLGAIITEYVAMKNQIKEAHAAMKVMRAASVELLEKIATEMKKRGKTRCELQATGDVIMQSSRRVVKKPKLKELSTIYHEVLGDQLADKLEKHIEGLSHQETVVGLTHKKLKPASDMSHADDSSGSGQEGEDL